MNAITRTIQPSILTWSWLTWRPAKQAGVREQLMTLLLFVLVFISSFAVVYLKHYDRNLNYQMQTLQHQINELQLERSQLLLELSTWATPARIQSIVRDKRSMKLPGERDVIMVQM